MEPPSPRLEARSSTSCWRSPPAAPPRASVTASARKNSTPGSLAPSYSFINHLLQQRLSSLRLRCLPRSLTQQLLCLCHVRFPDGTQECLRCNADFLTQNAGRPHQLPRLLRPPTCCPFRRHCLQSVRDAYRFAQIKE